MGGGGREGEGGGADENSRTGEPRVVWGRGEGKRGRQEMRVAGRVDESGKGGEGGRGGERGVSECGQQPGSGGDHSHD